MAKVRVHNFSISLDGCAAGPNQRLEAPFGDGPPLHDWMFATRMGHELLGKDGGDEGIDNLEGGARYECTEFVGSGSVAHARLVRAG